MIDGFTHARVSSVTFATREQAVDAAKATLRAALGGLLSAHEVTTGALPS